MFSLVHGFYEELTYVRERPIALLGVDGSGKSCIQEWFKLYFASASSKTIIPSSSAPDATTSVSQDDIEAVKDSKDSKDAKDSDNNDNDTKNATMAKSSPTTNKKYKKPPSSPRTRVVPLNLDKVIPTVGLNVAKLRVAGEKALVWDLGGLPALRSIWESYLTEAEALIWVVDSTDRSKLVDSRDTLKQLLTRSNLKHSPLLVFANKQDVDDAMDPVKISLALDLLMEAELRPQCIQPCSSKTGHGIREGLEWMMSCLQRGAEVKPGMRIP